MSRECHGFGGDVSLVGELRSRIDARWPRLFFVDEADPEQAVCLKGEVGGGTPQILNVQQFPGIKPTVSLQVKHLASNLNLNSPVSPSHMSDSKSNSP